MTVNLVEQSAVKRKRSAVVKRKSMDSIGPTVPVTSVRTQTFQRVQELPHSNTTKVTTVTYEVTTYDKNGRLSTSTNVYQNDYLV